jgi:hypothetical protein
LRALCSAHARDAAAIAGIHPDQRLFTAYGTL